MKLIRQILVVSHVAALSAMISCADIIEKNIQDEKPVLLSPLDSMVEAGTLTFWWTEVDGATGYRLQLVSPTFANVQRLYLDTLVSTEKFDFNPLPGKYQWRVQAVNSAYTSNFSDTLSLEVLQGSDLSRFNLQLTSPARNAITNNRDVVFSWEPIFIADAYRFQLFGNNTTLKDDTTAAGQYQLTLPNQDGTYQWQVTAFNDESQSMSAKYSLLLDMTIPNQPELGFPKADSVVDFTTPLKFTWTRKSTDVQTDIFNIVNEDGSGVDGFSPKNLSTSFIEVSNQSSIFKANKIYTWSVISVDFAGNRSEAVMRSFKVGQ